jgi:hypothetical protein
LGDITLGWLDCCCGAGVVCCWPDVPAPAPACAFAGTDHTTIPEHSNDTARARRIFISKSSFDFG